METDKVLYSEDYKQYHILIELETSPKVKSSRGEKYNLPEEKFIRFFLKPTREVQLKYFFLHNYISFQKFPPEKLEDCITAAKSWIDDHQKYFKL